MISDPNAEHQIQIKQLGNDSIYVTCNCLVRETLRLVRRHANARTRSFREKNNMSELVSLGDFPVGTPVAELLKAYNAHLG